MLLCLFSRQKRKEKDQLHFLNKLLIWLEDSFKISIYYVYLRLFSYGCQCNAIPSSGISYQLIPSFSLPFHIFKLLKSKFVHHCACACLYHLSLSISIRIQSQHLQICMRREGIWRCVRYIRNLIVYFLSQCK